MLQLLRPSLLGCFSPSIPCRPISSSRAEVSMMVKVLEKFTAAELPTEWPYDASDMERMDESADINFYSAPRYVTHIDGGAIAAVSNYYRNTLPEGADVLDLCSSWISHLPQEKKYGRVVGVGMNALELEANKQLSEWVQADLNADPLLPFDDASFDACLNVVSVDYLTRPNEVFNEMHRVLRPGGIAIMSFSNRCFPTKAVSRWLAEGDAGRRRMVGTYFACSPPGGWTDITALDITGTGEKPKNENNPFEVVAMFLKQSVGDPMFVVQARKAQ